MELFQIHIRLRNPKCSHTETIYVDAKDCLDADERAYRLFGETHTIKAVLRYTDKDDQERCECGASITHVCEPREPSEPLESDSQYWSCN